MYENRKIWSVIQNIWMISGLQTLNNNHVNFWDSVILSFRIFSVENQCSDLCMTFEQKTNVIVFRVFRGLILIGGNIAWRQWHSPFARKTCKDHCISFRPRKFEMIISQNSRNFHDCYLKFVILISFKFFELLIKF